MSYLIPLLILVLIIYFIVRANRRPGSAVTASHASGGLNLGLSKEDATSQVFIVLALAFFGLLLGYLNDYIGRPIGLGGIALIVLLATLAIAYYYRLIALAVIALGGIPLWWGFQSLHWIHQSDGRRSYVVAGFLVLSLMYSALGYAHKNSAIYKRVADIYQALGGLGITFILFVYSVKFMLATLFRAEFANVPQAAIWQIIVTIAIGLLIFIVSLAYANFTKKITAVETVAGLCFAALAAGMLFMSGQMYDSAGALSATGTAWGLLMNLALILELLVWLFLGYMRQNAAAINIATGAIFVLIFVKYVDWFYHSLEKGLFFIGAGALLLLIGAAMEKGRRFMLEHMKAGA